MPNYLKSFVELPRAIAIGLIGVCVLVFLLIKWALFGNMEDDIEELDDEVWNDEIKDY